MSKAELLGDYIVKHNATIRQTAHAFSVSKSMVHVHVSKKLSQINYSLYLRVRKVLDFNFKMRNIRGGMATKNKYKKLKDNLINTCRIN